jgi:hypothetical protein
LGLEPDDVSAWGERATPKVLKDCVELDGKDINDKPTFGCVGGGDKRGTPFAPFELGLAKFIHAGVGTDGVTPVSACAGLVDNGSPNKSTSKELAVGIMLVLGACFW